MKPREGYYLAYMPLDRGCRLTYAGIPSFIALGLDYGQVPTSRTYMGPNRDNIMVIGVSSQDDSLVPGSWEDHFEKYDSKRFLSTSILDKHFKRTKTSSLHRVL